MYNTRSKQQHNKTKQKLSTRNTWTDISPQMIYRYWVNIQKYAQHHLLLGKYKSTLIIIAKIEKNTLGTWVGEDVEWQELYWWYECKEAQTLFCDSVVY